MLSNCWCLSHVSFDIFFSSNLVSSSFRYGICVYDSLTFSPSYRINKILNIQLPRLLSLHSIYIFGCVFFSLCLSFMSPYIAVGFSLSSSVSRPLNLFTLFFYFWRWIFNAALIPSSVSLSIDCSRYFQVKSGRVDTLQRHSKKSTKEQQTALQFNNDFWQTKCQWIFEVLTIMHFGCSYHGDYVHRGLRYTFVQQWQLHICYQTIDILHDISFRSVSFRFNSLKIFSCVFSTKASSSWWYLQFEAHLPIDVIKVHRILKSSNNCWSENF